MSDNQYQYIPLSEPIPVTKQEWPEGTVPLVHIRTMTYNHEDYIRECIKGIFMQKTTFPVQVLIHDDASTDETADIVRDYEKKYPGLIKAYYQKKNTYQIRKKHGTYTGSRDEFFSWRIGKYEATCEGDDYWTDPLKLQKQVNFMENNTEFSMCCTNYSVVNEKGKVLHELAWGENKRAPIITHEMILREYKPKTLTSLIRSSTLPDKIPDVLVDCPNGDNVRCALVSEYGPAAYLDFNSGCYRINEKGVWSEKSELEQKKMQLKTYLNMKKYFKEKAQQEAIDERIGRINRRLSYAYAEEGKLLKSYKEYAISLKYEKQKIFKSLALLNYKLLKNFLRKIKY